jgi:hypothetical protein
MRPANISQARVAICTAIINYKDDLKHPQFEKPDNWDAFCFTDQEVYSDFYKVIKINELPYTDNTRNAKTYKVLPHVYFPSYDYVIWVDSKINLLAKFLDLANEMYQHKAAVFPHPERDCLYAEAEKCINFNLDDASKIKAQVSAYRRSGMPYNFGLASCGVLFMHANDSQVKQFNELWWNEIEKFSRRDQLSFPYIEWQTGFKWHRVNEPWIWDNQYLQVIYK